jgi:hypothetical protein
MLSKKGKGSTVDIDEKEMNGCDFSFINHIEAARRKISSRPKEAEVGRISVVGGNSPDMFEPAHSSKACDNRSNLHSLV